MATAEATTSTKKKAVKKEEESELEIIAPSAEIREWTLGKNESQRTYTQKPLSFLKKMRLFAHVGGTLRNAMATGEPGAISELLGGSSMLTSGEDGDDAEAFISLATSLAMYLPELLQEAYCIVLDVPPAEKGLAISNMNLAEDEGGLSDEDGIEIINVFFAQNWSAVQDFFTDHLPRLAKTAQAKKKKEDASEEASE